MNEATGHLNFDEFAGMVGFPPSEVMSILRDLAKTGHLRKVGGGYGLTEKGKSALKAIVPVPAGKEFKFYFAIDKPAEYCASTPIEFYDALQRVDVSSLEFHMLRGDFQLWIKSALENFVLAEKIEELKKAGLLGETLRVTLLETLETVYDFP
jgi:hypothetical protein